MVKADPPAQCFATTTKTLPLKTNGTPPDPPVTQSRQTLLTDSFFSGTFFNKGKKKVPNLEPKKVPNSNLEPKKVLNSNLEPKKVPNSNLEPKEVTNSNLEPKEVPNLNLEPKEVTNSNLEPKEVTNLNLEPKEVTNLESKKVTQEPTVQTIAVSREKRNETVRLMLRRIPEVNLSESDIKDWNEDDLQNWVYHMRPELYDTLVGKVTPTATTPTRKPKAITPQVTPPTPLVQSTLTLTFVTPTVTTPTETTTEPIVARDYDSDSTVAVSNIVQRYDLRERVTAEELDVHFSIEAEESTINVFEYGITFCYAVAYCFETKYGAPEASESQWSGKGGLVPKVKADLGLPEHTRPATIRRIFQDVVDCKKEGVQYVAKLNLASCGRKAVITVGSTEAQIIADCVESGLSSITTWSIVNKHRQKQLLPSLTIGSVCSCIRRLQPKIVKIKQIKQGSINPNAPTSKARFGWSLQLGVRFGLFDVIKVRDILRNHKNNKYDGLAKKQ